LAARQIPLREIAVWGLVLCKKEDRLLSIPF